jgi:hypothetical protein
MSRDDECSTEYFGPGAEVWDSPDGRTLQMSPAQVGYRRTKLLEHGWIRNREKKPLVLGGTVHRKGCSFARSARCTCAYLAQWDRSPAYTAPSFAASDYQTQFPSVPHAYVEGNLSDAIYARPAALRGNAPGIFPMEEKDYYPQVDKPGLTALTVNGEIWGPRTTAEAEKVTEIGFPALPAPDSTAARLYILQLEHQGLRDRMKSQVRWNLFLLMVLAANGIYITGHATGWF